MMDAARRAWLPLMIVLVVLVAGFVVLRVRTFADTPDGTSLSDHTADHTEPFNPKTVRYEVFGDGSYADINYLNLDSDPQQLTRAALPWSLTLSTTKPSVFPNVVAQGDSRSLSCRITVNDQIREQRTVSGLNAQTFCMVKGA